MGSLPAQHDPQPPLASTHRQDAHDPGLVSAVIIFLNAQRFLQEAIESILAQTYVHWELLLVDDGSSDGSTALARRYAERDPGRVRYLEHPGHENRGMSASRNLGLSHARGEYMAFLDADDVWLKEKLERQVAILSTRPEIDMVYGNTQFWYSWTGSPKDLSRDCLRGIGIPPNTVVTPPGLTILCYPLGDAPSPATCSILVRRSTVDVVGGFEAAFRGMFEDQAFLAKIYLTATVFVSGECWDKYRLHPDSCVSVAMKTGQDDAAKRSFLNWLEAYLSEEGVKDAAIWQALRRTLWPYRHPLLHALSQRVGRFTGQVGHTTWTLNNRLARVIARKSTGKVTASPNPILVSDRFAQGATTLSWATTGTTAIEVHVDAPDGPLLCRADPIGSATTGPWVIDGMAFYLQDVSAGLPLTSANTLAVTKVKVVAVVNPRADTIGPAST